MIDLHQLSQAIGIHPRTVCEIGVNAPDKCSLAKFHGTAKMVLVEPLPWLADALRVAYPFATVHACAIGATAGEALLYDRGEGSWIDQVPDGGAPDEHPKHSAMRRDKFNAQFVRKVEVKTADEIDDGTIDILAIDVEGAEWLVLQNIVSRPKLLRVETHFSHSGYMNPHYAEIMEWAFSNGYTLAAQDVSDSLFIRV
jgi:FkbM family methyltransferase